MAISDRRKIVAAFTLAAGGFGLIGVSSGATFTDTVTGSITVSADLPPTPTPTATATAEPTEPTPGKSDDPGTGSPSPSGSGSATPTPTPTSTPAKPPKLTVDPDDHSNWSTDDTVCTYKKEIRFTDVTAKKLGVFTAENTGETDLKVTTNVTLPTALSGKVTAELRLVKGTAELKGKAKGKVDSATYEFWLTPKTSGYTISKDDAQKIKITFVASAV
ncbi:hypothetical protein ACFWJM_27760 [Streptomyces sp. NPDC127077]|uniref:hypothetical protein n=1 Tax=Streptomyces sp. NPDC127077 TaxID=3347131 RepID=UPI00365FEE35